MRGPGIRVRALRPLHEGTSTVVPPRTRRRSLFTTVCLTLAALVFVSCGGGESGGGGTDDADSPSAESASQVVAKSAARTISSGTARVAITSAVSDLGGEATVLMSAAGIVDFDTGRSVLTVTAPGLADTIEVRQLDPQTGFVSVPPLELPAGKRWIRVETGASNGSALAMSSDPASSLTLMAGLIADAEEAGRESLRDTETTHYTIKVEFGRLTELAIRSGNLPGGELAYLDPEGLASAKTAEGGLWIDDEGRIRKFEYALVSGLGETTSTTTTVEYFDFGTEVVVDEPPAGEIASREELGSRYDDLLVMLAGLLGG